MLINLKQLRTRSSEEGFTLIELLIVIVVIGILVAIAIPIFANQQSEAIKAGVKSDVRNLNTEVVSALTKNPTSTDLGSIVAIPDTSDAATVLTAEGAWDNYTIRGVNAEIGGTEGNADYCWQFASTEGIYRECVVIPVGVGGGSGSSDDTCPTVEMAYGMGFDWGWWVDSPVAQSQGITGADMMTDPSIAGMVDTTACSSDLMRGFNDQQSGAGYNP